MEIRRRHYIVSEIIPKTESSGLQEQVDQINCWSNENNFQLNSQKCKELRIDFTRHRHTDDPITVNDQTFEVVQSSKILGVTIRQDLKWNDHVTEITHKASKRLYPLRILKRAGVDVNSFSAILLYVHPINSGICLPDISKQFASVFV